MSALGFSLNRKISVFCGLRSKLSHYFGLVFWYSSSFFSFNWDIFLKNASAVCLRAKIFKVLVTPLPWETRVRCWQPPPLAETPVEGDVRPIFKVTFEFVSIFSEVNVNLSCSHGRVLSLNLWQGLGVQLSQGSLPEMKHWSEAFPWAARHPSSWGGKLWGKDDIHLRTLQHPGLGAGTVNSHGETPRNLLTSLDLTQSVPRPKVLPAQDMPSSCPYIYGSPGRANRAHFQTSVTQPLSSLKPKRDLPYRRPTN